MPIQAPERDKRIRVGAVNYLNSKPLVEGLAQSTPDFRVIFDLPSRLADALAADQLDVALLPVFEYFRHPNWQLVSDACIACRGPVWSVKLFFRVPPQDVRTLDLDEGSRTSGALARVLLSRQFELQPELSTLPIGAGIADSTADAVLLIGDRAMFDIHESFVEVWDLGERWWQWTGLPFVFATWVARPGIDTAAIEPTFSASRNCGLQRIDAIAHREADILGLPLALVRDYLRDKLWFRLGRQERRGLALFHRHCVELGLAPLSGPLFEESEVDGFSLVG
ncbi:MAG: menaquinone biosynthesis protein [Pirellulales bacterium]